MKNTKLIALILVFCLLLALCACGVGGGGNNANGSGNTENEATPADISEAAMNNFIKKLQACNYVAGKELNGKVSVVSPEQVHILYGDEEYSFSFAYMTLKGETFRSLVEGDAIEEVSFISKDNAVDALGQVLPNYWIDITDGNLFELFYNDPEKPLEFTSNEMDVKMTLGALAGYSELIVKKMQEVRMVMDAQDPVSVRFTADIPDAGTVKYEDLDLTLTFGEAKSDPRIDKWCSAPVYPANKTAWTFNDTAMLDTVFNRGWGRTAVPFPAAASYALIMDDRAYGEFGGVRITDAHFTEKDVEDYKALLLEKGFRESPVTLDDGSSATVYRLLLREDYKAYSQIYLEYDNGLYLEGTLYHDDPVYEDFDQISAAVAENGFAALPETDIFTGWKAANHAATQSESWAYFFDYNFYTTFTLEYSDFESARTYLENYKDDLIRNHGFQEGFAPGDNTAEAESPNGFISFKYTFKTDGSVYVEFKNEKSLTVEETLAKLKEHGLPETDIKGVIGCREQTRYQYERSGFEGLFMFCYQTFDSAAEAEAYLDSYVPYLEDLGYIYFDPQKLDSQRQFLYFNEELRKYVGFDFIPGANSANINWEFFSAESELESIMSKTLGR